MILRPSFRIGHDPLENFKHQVRIDIESSLFGHFAPDPFLQLLTRFDDAARQGPVAFQRLLAALHQQNFAVFENQRANAEERARWITRLLRSSHLG